MHSSSMEQALLSRVGRSSTSVLPLPAAVPGGQAAPVKLDAGTQRHDFHDDPVWEFIEEIWGEVPTFIPVTELLVFAHPLLSNECVMPSPRQRAAVVGLCPAPAPREPIYTSPTPMMQQADIAGHVLHHSDRSG